MHYFLVVQWNKYENRFLSSNIGYRTQRFSMTLTQRLTCTLNSGSHQLWCHIAGASCHINYVVLINTLLNITSLKGNVSLVMKTYAYRTVSAD